MAAPSSSSDIYWLPMKDSAVYGYCEDTRGPLWRLLQRDFRQLGGKQVGFTHGIAPLCLESKTTMDPSHDRLVSTLHSHTQEDQVIFLLGGLYHLSSKPKETLSIIMLEQQV